MRQIWVYILSNYSRTLYVGVTNNLERRTLEHKSKYIDGFPKRYNLTQLVYFEEFKYVNDAIAREKQLKGLRRRRKIDLIEEMNPTWRDLSEDWFLGIDPSRGSG